MSDSESDPGIVVSVPGNDVVIAKLFAFAILLAVLPVSLLYSVMQGAADGATQVLLSG